MNTKLHNAYLLDGNYVKPFLYNKILKHVLLSYATSCLLFSFCVRVSNLTDTYTKG
jgi:hypothetical protein